MHVLLVGPLQQAKTGLVWVDSVYHARVLDLSSWIYDMGTGQFLLQANFTFVSYSDRFILDCYLMYTDK